MTDQIKKNILCTLMVKHSIYIFSLLKVRYKGESSLYLVKSFNQKKIDNAKMIMLTNCEVAFYKLII